MFSNKIGINRFTVIPGYTVSSFIEDFENSGYVLSKKMKDNFNDLYGFAKKHLKDFENRKIDSKSSISGAIWLISQWISEELELYVTLFGSGMYIGRHVPHRFDFILFFIKPFYDLRKHELFPIIARLYCQIQNRLDCGNDGYWEMAEDHFEQLICEEPEEYKHEYQWHHKITLPFLQKMKAYENEPDISKNDIDKLCKALPGYVTFFKNMYRFLGSGFYWSDVHSCDVPDDDDMETYIMCEQRVQLMFSDEKENRGIDAEISSYIQSYYQEAYLGGFYAITSVKSENVFKELDIIEKSIKTMFNTIGKDYECYSKKLW